MAVSCADATALMAVISTDATALLAAACPAQALNTKYKYYRLPLVWSGVGGIIIISLQANNPLHNVCLQTCPFSSTRDLLILKGKE